MLFSSSTTMTKSAFEIVVVDQGGSLKDFTIKCERTNVDCEESKQILRKACGLKLTSTSKKRVVDSFELLHVFNRDSFPKEKKKSCNLATKENEYESILVFGKREGRAGSENKYEFPPPIDNEIYYDNLCLVKCFTSVKDDEEQRVFLSMDVNQWKRYYEALFDGFDDCKDIDEEPDELDLVSDKKKTKDGYLKDGFIVDDEEDEDDYDEYAETELSEEEDFEFSDED